MKSLTKILNSYTPVIKPDILNRLKAELEKHDYETWKQGCIDYKMFLLKNTDFPERSKI